MPEEHLHLIVDIPVKALIQHEGKILLVEEGARGGWALPGGRMNIGEQPLEALHREIHEELGVRIVAGAPLDCAVFTSPSGKSHFVVVFAATLVDPTVDIPVARESEIESIKWVTMEEALTMPLRDEYRMILERL